MQPTIDELRAKGDKALMDFLKADLDLGFTFARLAQIEKGLDEPAADQAKHHLARVIQTVKHFEPRIKDHERAQEIGKRLAKLEQLFSSVC